MRSLALFTTMLLAAACTTTPAASVPESPGASESPGADARCPAPTAACMNEENHAQCLEIAAACKGEILQLESCPLQFSCSDDSAGPPAPDANTPVSKDAAGYDSCAGKRCGDACNLCAPGDADCVETAEVKVCSQSGTCSGQAPNCG